MSLERPIRAAQRGLRRPCGRHFQRGEDASRRLLQPTYSTSTRDAARLPRSERLAAPSARVGVRLTPFPPASARPPTPSFSGEERRTGATLRCGRRSRPLTSLLCLTSDALCRPPVPSARDGQAWTARIASAAHPPRCAASTEQSGPACAVTSPPIQSAFYRQVPLASRLRAPRRTRHRAPGLAAAEPASDASFTLPCFRLEGLDLPRGPELITPVRTDQAPPVDFCNHHGSQARPRG
jgi:hypothetical protein